VPVWQRGRLAIPTHSNNAGELIGPMRVLWLHTKPPFASRPWHSSSELCAAAHKSHTEVHCRTATARGDAPAVLRLGGRAQQAGAGAAPVTPRRRNRPPRPPLLPPSLLPSPSHSRPTVPASFPLFKFIKARRSCRVLALLMSTVPNLWLLQMLEDLAVSGQEAVGVSTKSFEDMLRV